ncbi:MAG: hypothetical protein P1P88_25115, partial [Bacteroidales bacterium]|nr:hypothetical protein [Bacteroidales bacterium]
WFKEKYPNGLDSIVKLANSFGCKIGLWIGPDGYGTTDSSAVNRIEMLNRLTKDYGVALLKMDKCCSDLKPENEKYFIEAMQKCYANNPALIVLNHRITLSEAAQQYTTTFLWEGAETYIDVSYRNEHPAPHHRYTLDRGLPPDLKRLTEDHGVCLSSYLDYWEDDLILQAFNRNLILAPEIYGNPWLLNDNEFAKLARIFNLHRKYNSILVNATKLPEDKYGENAVSRGDNNTRLLTLRNLTWKSKKFNVNINKSIGIRSAEKFEVRQYHPFEKIIGEFNYGDQVQVEVLPFRTCLLKISSELSEFGIKGSKYSFCNDAGKEWQIDLLGMPGETNEISLAGENHQFKKAFIEGKDVSEIIDNKSTTIQFGEKSLINSYHRYMGPLKACDVPSNISNFIENVYFSADNNCLEVRSLIRSGNTKIAAVKEARDAFFNDKVFLDIGAWDKFALDNDSTTFFKVRNYCGIIAGVLRIKLPECIQFDELKLEGTESEYKAKEALISSDLLNWAKANVIVNNNSITIQNKTGQSIKYVKLNPSPNNISEIKASYKNQLVDISASKLSNLFPDKPIGKVQKAWKGSFKINEWIKNSTLSVAIEGDYGEDGAFAVIKANDTLIGAFDRSPAFPFNNWEHVWCPQNGNYTYYFKVTDDLIHTEFTVYVFGLGDILKIKTPEVWLSAYPIPFEKKRLVLKKK